MVGRREEHAPTNVEATLERTTDPFEELDELAETVEEGYDEDPSTYSDQEDGGLITDGGHHELFYDPETPSDETLDDRVDQLYEETDGYLPGENGVGARDLQENGRAVSGPGSTTFEF